MKFVKKNRKRGFTIIELIVVSALIAILATLIISSAGKHRMEARDRVRAADIDKIRIALEQYRLACGEYPERLELNAHNGCAYGQKLGDFLRTIPSNPPYEKTPGLIRTYMGSNVIENEDDYFYSALSSRIRGKCYDYHIGTIFESGRSASFLKNDHDVEANIEPYKHECRNSFKDFGNERDDNQFRLYDFRGQWGK